MSIFLHDGFSWCNGLWCHYSVCLLVEESVTELTPFRNSIYTVPVVTDMHHRTELPFIDEFWCALPLHLIKNEWQNAVSLWCMLQVGPPYLHYCCAVVLHSSIVLPPVGHSSNHEYHCCQLTEQSSSVSNFYHTFKVFIWLTFFLLRCSRTAGVLQWRTVDVWSVPVICCYPLSNIFYRTHKQSLSDFSVT